MGVGVGGRGRKGGDDEKGKEREGGVSRTLYPAKRERVMSGSDRLDKRELKLGPGRSGAAGVMHENVDNDGDSERQWGGEVRWEG